MFRLELFLYCWLVGLVYTQKFGYVRMEKFAFAWFFFFAFLSFCFCVFVFSFCVFVFFFLTEEATVWYDSARRIYCLNEQRTIFENKT